MRNRIATEPLPGEPEPLLVDLPAAARILSIGQSTLRVLVARGEVESVMIGGRRLFPMAGLEAYVATLRGRSPHLHRRTS